jgi:hypothetical protein
MRSAKAQKAGCLTETYHTIRDGSIPFSDLRKSCLDSDADSFKRSATQISSAMVQGYPVGRKGTGAKQNRPGCSSGWPGCSFQKSTAHFTSNICRFLQAVYNSVMEFYDHGKPWKEGFVKFTIHFDEQGRVAAITYTPFPAEHRDALLERVRGVWQPFGKDLTGKLVNVVVGFKNPNRN